MYYFPQYDITYDDYCDKKKFSNDVKNAIIVGEAPVSIIII